MIARGRRSLTLTKVIKMDSKKQIREYAQTLSLGELELKLEGAKRLFFGAVIDNDPQTKRYLEAYNLASDLYYGRKYPK